MEYIKKDIWQRFGDYLEIFHINKTMIPKTSKVGEMVHFLLLNTQGGF